MRADHHVHPRGLGLDEPLVLLGQAAGHHDAQPRVGQLQRLEVAQGAVQAPVGVLPDGAGVEHDDLGIRGLLRGRVAVRLQEAGDAFGVVLVHLASERADEVAAAHASMLAAP